LHGLIGMGIVGRNAETWGLLSGRSFVRRLRGYHSISFSIKLPELSLAVAAMT
jgi:hypothetical protein